MSLKAAPQVQWRLLDVQGFDTRLAQLAHKARTLPERAAAEGFRGQERALADQMVAARTVVSDIQRELTKAEGDVEQVRTRSARDQARLDSGQGTVKDLQALSLEVENLARRQAVLEDVELEVMERMETAEGAVADLEKQADALRADLGGAENALAAALKAVEEEQAKVARQRADAVAGVPADLVAEYDRIGAKTGGAGAARLYQRRCEGCRIELNVTEINTLRAAAEDEVVYCEECGRILIRTGESGL